MAASRFVLHGRLWLLVVPILGAIVVPIVSTSEDLQISDRERESVQVMVGPPGEAALAAIADERFKRWLLDSGAVSASYAGSGAGAGYGGRGAHGGNGAHTRGPMTDGGASTFGHRWLDRAWLMTYRAIYRLSVFESWLPGGLVVGMALINDGAVARRMRAADTGAAASPLAFHLAAHGLLLGVGLTICALLFPDWVPGYWWVGMLCVACALCWRLGRSYGAGD